jgi:hypothetical protein
MERPDLIDAGFHKLVGKFDKLQIDDTIGEMMKEVVPMKEMMRYKGTFGKRFRASWFSTQLASIFSYYSFYPPSNPICHRIFDSNNRY